jgi:hypothetical protein
MHFSIGTALVAGGEGANCLSGGVGTFLAGYAKQSWGLDGVFA